MPPVISNLVLTATESSIVATWNTDIPADSNLTATGPGFPSGKPAVDNGYAANSTVHQCVVSGLLSNSIYSCVVTSGGVSSSPQNKTTLPARNRRQILSASNGAASTCAFAPPSGGDSIYTFKSSDGISYITCNDGYGFSGVNNAGANFQIGKLTDDNALTGANVNIMSSYLGVNTTNGTDGPGGTALRGGNYGPFGLNGHLFMFLARNNQSNVSLYGNVIRDNGDHGATWNRYDIPSSFSANGQGPGTGIFEYANSNYAVSVPVLYGADDGTLGYNTAGNGIDGGNAYVYISFKQNYADTNLFMMRWPRIAFDACDNTKIQYWTGPSSPTPADFVNDSNWSASDSGKTAIITTAYNSYGGRISFVPGINRYVLLDNDNAVHGTATWHFFEAPTPAGPWTQFYTVATSPNGWIVPAFMHSDLINNSATDNVALRMLYSGDFTNASLYKAHVSTLTLRTTAMPTNTRVQAKGESSAGQSGSQYTLTYDSNVTAGNILVAGSRSATGVTFNSIVFTIGGVDYTGIKVYYTQQGAAAIFGGLGYIIAPASGPCTVKLNWSGANAGGLMVIGEWNGPNSVRTPPAAATGTNTTPLSNAIAATAGDLLIGTCAINTATSITAGSGYTSAATSTSGGNFFGSLEENLNAAGGSTTAGFTGTAGTNSWIAGILAFFAANFTISGNAGVAGATVAYSGPSSGSVVADGAGNFVITVNQNGVYTITPSLAGYSFSPVNSTQTMVSANISGVNFTATIVSGGIPVNPSISSGIPCKLNGGTPLTAPIDLPFSFVPRSGNFSATFQAVGTVTALTASLQVSLDNVTWSDYISAGSFISNGTPSVTVRPLIAGARYQVHITALTGSQDIWVVAE